MVVAGLSDYAFGLGGAANPTYGLRRWCLSDYAVPANPTYGFYTFA